MTSPCVMAAMTYSRLVAQSANPHLRRLSLSGGILHHVIRWNVAFYGQRAQTVMEIKQFTCCDKTLTFPPKFDTLLEKDEMPSIGVTVINNCHKLILWLLKGHAFLKKGSMKKRHTCKCHKLHKLANETKKATEKERKKYRRECACKCRQPA